MPSPYTPVRQGTYYDPKRGRIMVHRGCSVSIAWSTTMLDYLHRHYPTTLNDELAGCLGVSVRTMIRKARELGLEKDPQWLADIYEERRRWAQIEAKRKGHPGGFKKGVRSNPGGEFKPGHQESPETRAKRSEALRQWHRRHPGAAKARALRGAETRRSKQNNF